MNLYLASIAVLLILIVFLAFTEKWFVKYIIVYEKTLGALIGFLIGFIIFTPMIADFPNYGKKYYHLNEDLSLKEITSGGIYFHKPFCSRMITSSEKLKEKVVSRRICGVFSSVTISGPEFEFEASQFRKSFGDYDVVDFSTLSPFCKFDAYLNQKYGDPQYNLEKLNKCAADFMRSVGMNGKLEMKVSPVVSTP